MIITLLAGGSRGDTQPYIALGSALQKAGHTARVATHENYADFVKSFGLEFFPIRGDVRKITASMGANQAMSADNPLKVLLSFKTLQSLVFDLQQDFFNACQGSDAIVYHPGLTIGYFAARQLGIPAVFAPPFPMTPTRAYPALLFYDKVRLGGAVNRITHKLFEQIMWSASNAPVSQFWKKQFGRLPEGFASPYGKQTSQRYPTITSCSPSVFPKPADWPEHVHMTGYWFLDDEPDWQPSPDLLNFLQSGEPPIYVGFGSVGNPTQAVQTTQLVINALQRSGQRGILATGWNAMAKQTDLPESIFMLESAPHAWLFPKMAAVVHHGGAGTTGAGLRAGVPSIIIPSSNDQFAWAQRVFELGVGPKPIPRKKLTVENLSEAFNVARSASIKSAAQDLGRKIQNENGLQAAIRVIERCFEG